MKKNGRLGSFSKGDRSYVDDGKMELRKHYLSTIVEREATIDSARIEAELKNNSCLRFLRLVTSLEWQEEIFLFKSN